MGRKLLVVLTLVLLMALVVAGNAFAVPRPLDIHEPTPVAGTLEYSEGTLGDAVPYGDGSLLAIPGLLTYQMHGDFEGVYIIDAFWIFDPNAPGGGYTIEGRATFTGTVLGRRCNWEAEVVGSGEVDLDYPGFAGAQTWVSTIVSSGTPLSHLRGDITVTDVYGYGPPDDFSEYEGELTWQTGKKHHYR
ncbi:MAG: hypothetical protein ACYC5Q_03865 [Thermoleophilia bacterium]